MSDVPFYIINQHATPSIQSQAMPHSKLWRVEKKERLWEYMDGFICFFIQ